MRPRPQAILLALAVSGASGAVQLMSTSSVRSVRSLHGDNKGEYELAIASCKRAIAIDPKDARTHYTLGVTYNNKGEYDLAIASCKRAIAINPAYARAHYNLGLAYYNKGEDDLAIASFKRVIAIDAEDAQARRCLTTATTALSKQQKAALVLDVATKNVCFTCSRPPAPGTRLLRCTSCKTTTYCGRRCQVAHWKTGHKAACKNHSSCR